MKDRFLHIFSREIAKSLGINVYFTGESCRHGHISSRYCSNTCCVRCKQISDAKQYTDKPDQHKERANQWYAENKQRRIETNKAWLSVNPGVASARYKIWRENNRDVVNAHDRNRRARQKSSLGTHTALDVQKLYVLQKGRCANCNRKTNQGNRKNYHVDHVMPLALGGGNGPDNLQILCPRCNLEKRAKHPDAWAKENGRLL